MKKLSPVEVVRAHIERINELDRELHSLQTVMEDEALEQARTIEKGDRMW